MQVCVNRFRQWFIVVDELLFFIQFQIEVLVFFWLRNRGLGSSQPYGVVSKAAFCRFFAYIKVVPDHTAGLVEID